MADMDSLERLLLDARAGRFEKPPVKPPTKPVDAANDPPPALPLPPALERATAALTAAERALLTPDVCAALAAEVPSCWADFPDSLRRDWLRERLGLSVRFWNVTCNGRRWLVEFVEPQTRAGLLEQAARHRPGEPLELEPALALPALCDNAPTPTQPLSDNAMLHEKDGADSKQMNTRPPEPESLIQWREWLRAGPPKCCFTCDKYDASGHCLVFDMRPPDDFAGTVDACERWIMELPF